MFLEHKLLYLGQAAPVPEEPYALPIGRADVKRAGTDVTMVATMAMVGEALRAADILAREGLSLEVIDPRSLRPLDIDTMAESLRKTHRGIVVQEAWRTGGLGAEITAALHEAAFDWLDAPIARLGNPDLPMPYHDRLERAVIPDAKVIAAAARIVADRS